MRSFGYRFLVYQRIAHLTLNYEITFPLQILTIITIFLGVHHTIFKLQIYCLTKKAMQSENSPTA